ncbi:methylated-DNA--[protein]-cysteine S-methyltransferase [Leptospira wolffii]|uniref:methylated-DNA--[protein]-cysteine S-methyltransferase n=1 Tax=Leptospira wolffii TaxID=409998 RepID=UPI0010827C77|nr:methylated-DNA--[protein]-cysteine S-methyltransferase [Leptospira wolffii]TGL50843.1 methylated-DNA--[protein]-cysteine S-methyltransferase [Leptospira wolffii]
MKEQDLTDFNRIAEAIDYIRKNFQKQPDLEKIAEKLHLSPYHFQRMFSDWAGVSPKKFLQYTTLEYAKKLLRQGRSTLLDAAFESGLSGTGRLHDLFVNIEGMTPGEYKNGGESLSINYRFSESSFGRIIIASTHKGICYLAFCDDQRKTFSELKSIFPNANFQEKTDTIQDDLLDFLNRDWKEWKRVKLHLKGTDFQIKVWESLLRIPPGSLTTYGDLAKSIGNPNASRAVGSAVGDNPVAFLIPCHRVIRSNGEFGEYHWGDSRKAAMIGWEAARLDKNLANESLSENAI